MDELAPAGGLTVAVTLTQSGYRLTKAGRIEPDEGRKQSPSEIRNREEAQEPQIWLRLTPDNTVTVIIGKSEMGQGVSTSLPMILADELDADWKRVRFRMSPPGQEYQDPVWGTQTTGGSTSVRHLFLPLRKAGAAAREMLRKAASIRWGVGLKECEAIAGTIRNRRTGERFSFGQLSLEASKLPVPVNPGLKKPTTRSGIIGKRLPRLDVPEKVKGTAVFGMDIFLPGMLYGAVARPPAYGAWVISYDKKAAMQIAGVIRVLEIAGGVAVCADTFDAAWKGKKALNVGWDRGTHPGLDNDALDKDFAGHIQMDGVTAQKKGDPEAALTKAKNSVEATYHLPYLAHAAIEPMNCTACVCPDKCDIWAPTQDQSGIIHSAAELTGLDPEQIFVHTTYLGGGFGRRLEIDYAVEAVELSKTIGKPVKVVWTREDDFQNDFHRPASSCHMKAGLDSKARLNVWTRKVAAPSIFSRVYPDAVENGVDPAAVEGLADSQYEVPHTLTKYVRVDTPVPVGFWRSVGHSHNAFFVESFIDEAAHAAAKDPLEFRLALLDSHPRVRKVLETAADKAGWGKPRPAGEGRGIAQHFSYGSYVAQVADVSVDRDSGKVTVKRVVCAVDCGTVINPAIAAAQIRGGVIFGLSAAMMEEVLFQSGGVHSLNFNRYRIARMKDSPTIDVYFVEGPVEPGGIGEVAVPPLAPAIANAVFDAVGARLRRLPMRPAMVREAMKNV